MSRRVRDLLIGVALTAVTALAVLYQVNESVAAGGDPGKDNVPRLLCPLH